MTSRSPFNSSVHQQLHSQEARAEVLSCALFSGCCILLFGMMTIFGHTADNKSFVLLRGVFLGVTALLILLGALAYRGWWHPAMPYANTTLQISLLSFFLIISVKDQGPTFALSTALPMLYCLVISITAFRLSPGLSFFAGVLAAVEVIVIYAVFMRPELSAEYVANHPTISWPATVGRVIVLLAIGVACALAANSLRNQIVKRAKDQDHIQFLERTFGRFVAPEVAKQILNDESWMNPAEREAVVMFADLKGFTKYSAGRSPQEVAGLLNKCWEVAAAIVERHGGFINKYLGDGFLAVFGVPVELENAETAAAVTAAELQKELTPILEPQGLSVCIGVHSGPMIAGGIGAESRCEFTVIGSTVNLASRIEGLNRALETKCLTSEPVAEKLSENWELRDMGGQMVKGISDKVGVYEIIGRKKE